MHTADPAQLARIVGAAHVVAGGGPAQVRPGSIDEAAAVVALAHEHRWTVQPQGNGTRQAMCQHVGSGADIVLQLARLDRLIEHHPQNLVAAVQCGMPWSSLQQALATAGQRVPLDPPDPPHPPHRSGDARITGGTVGGVLATNAYGPLRLGYGTARDRLIGATIIRHDGKLIHTGGMVVKNVSGYDLGKLHIGSHGTLGIIVRANFKLAPLPAARATVALHVASREAAWRIVSALRMQPVNLVSAVQRDNELRLGLESSSDAALAAQLQLVPVDARAVSDDPPPVAHPFRIRLHGAPASMHALLDAAPCPAGTTETLLVGSGVAWWDCPTAPDVSALRAAFAQVIIERQPRELDARIPRALISDLATVRITRELKRALDPDGRFLSWFLAEA